MIKKVKPDYFHRKTYQVFWSELDNQMGILWKLAALFNEDTENE